MASAPLTILGPVPVYCRYGGGPQGLSLTEICARAVARELGSFFDSEAYDLRLIWPEQSKRYDALAADLTEIGEGLDEKTADAEREAWAIYEGEMEWQQ